MTEEERQHRLVLYDADLFMRHANPYAFDERVRRSVEEALAAYRVELFLACANMLGAASEAAWFQLASALSKAGRGTPRLEQELDSLTPSAAVLQQESVSSLEEAFTATAFAAAFAFRRSELSALADRAAYWRAQRNYGIHPAEGLGPDAFTQSSVAIQLMGATAYFELIARLLIGVDHGDSEPSSSPHSH